MSAAQLGEIDAAVRKALAAGPHARMRRGHRSPGQAGLLASLWCIDRLQPDRVAMTTDTVFDLASLTKPIVTATSVHATRAGRRKSAWMSRWPRILPEFGNRGKEAITVRQLLTHLGGLTPDNALADYADGPAKAWERICGLELRAKPGTDFIYSDVGFIVLGELVRRVSGERLDQFARTRSSSHWACTRRASCRANRCARARRSPNSATATGCRAKCTTRALSAGWSRGPRRPVLDCRRPGAVRPDAVGPRCRQRQPKC